MLECFLQPIICVTLVCPKMANKSFIYVSQFNTLQSIQYIKWFCSSYPVLQQFASQLVLLYKYMAFWVGIDIFVQVWPLSTAHCLTGAYLNAYPLLRCLHAYLLWRIRSDPKLLEGSGARCGYEKIIPYLGSSRFEISLKKVKILWKTDKNFQFLNITVHFKSTNSFL